MTFAVFALIVRQVDSLAFKNKDDPRNHTKHPCFGSASCDFVDRASASDMNPDS
jgi:hypothetical protein